jgi:predicted DsbA family dithiol-disulfide isomerase
MTGVLRLYTDFVCPFCFIAEESTVPRLLRELDLTLEWHGFELHPQTPPGGKPLGALFPGVDLAALHRQTKRFGATFGVTGFEPPNVLRNTRRALAIAELARERDRLPPYRHAVFAAHWREGKNIEDVATLAAIAAASGLDPEEAAAAADDPARLANVDARQARARREGVTGIPTFVFEPRGEDAGHAASETIVGCQPYEAVVAAAGRAGIVAR